MRECVYSLFDLLKHQRYSGTLSEVYDQEAETFIMIVTLSKLVKVANMKHEAVSELRRDVIE